MDTQDGFILGVYNYCDRWCEHCALASRCRVYAEDLSMSLDLPEEPPAASEPSSVVRSLGAVAAAFEESIPDEFFVWGATPGEEDPIELPRRPELEPAELEQQVHLRRPPADAANRVQPGDDLLVRHP